MRPIALGTLAALLLGLWVSVVEAGVQRGDFRGASDGKLAYSVGLNLRDCGRVVDCVDSRVLLRYPGRARSVTIGGCPPREDCDHREPSWSHDGRALIFVRSLSDSGREGFATDPAGRRMREVRTGGASSVAPSGRRIAYEGAAKSGGRVKEVLFVGSLDPTGETRLRTRGEAYQPSWSSRGRIAFSRFRRRTGFQIFTIDPDRGQARPLTRRGGEDPDWSPDGRRLAFLRDFTRRRDGIIVNDLMVIGARGGRVRRLTRGGAQSPAWSPSGREIAFVRGRRILAVNVKTEKVRELARVKRGRIIGSVDWQPVPRR